MNENSVNEKLVTERTSLADLCNLGDPVMNYNFDLYTNGDNPSTEVASVSVDNHLRIRFLVTETQTYRDLSGITVKLVIYQKLDDNPKALVLLYKLDKLVTVHTALDGEGGPLDPSFVHIEQVYDYTFVRIENK